MSEKVENYINWKGFETGAIDDTVSAFELWRIADELYKMKERKLALEVYKKAKEKHEKLIGKKGEEYTTLTPNPQSGIEILSLGEAVEYFSKRIEELERVVGENFE